MDSNAAHKAKVIVPQRVFQPRAQHKKAEGHTLTQGIHSVALHLAAQQRKQNPHAAKISTMVCSLCRAHPILQRNFCIYKTPTRVVGGFQQNHRGTPGAQVLHKLLQDPAHRIVR